MTRAELPGAVVSRPDVKEAELPGAVVSDRPGRLISKPFTTQTRDRQAYLKAVHGAG